ncbi:hypothetical protein [Pseudactinotalea suaedae]
MRLFKLRTGAYMGLIALATILPAAPSAAETDDETSSFFSESEDGSFNIGGHLSVRVDDTPMTTSDSSLQLVEDSYEEALVVCALRQAADEEGTLLNEETDLCEEDEDSLTTAEIVALVASEFKTLPLATPSITAQPDGDWALVNVDFVVYTEADQQLLSTTILGVPVTIRATPVHYSWDFGDGSPALSTTDPGRAYPNQTVAHVYTNAADAVAVSLTTSWQGELQINGSGPWLPIAGFATTTSSTDPVEIVAMDVHLVP